MRRSKPTVPLRQPRGISRKTTLTPRSDEVLLPSDRRRSTPLTDADDESKHRISVFCLECPMLSESHVNLNLVAQ